MVKRVAFEIPVLNIKMDLDRMGVPTEVLGEGSFGVVGLRYYTGPTKDGSFVNIPGAIATPSENFKFYDTRTPYLRQKEAGSAGCH